MNRHRAKHFRLRSPFAFAVVGVACLGFARSAAAQASDPSAEEKSDLAKQLSNPIASLVSVPFQFNWEQNVAGELSTRLRGPVHPDVGPSWTTWRDRDSAAAKGPVRSFTRE
jgi:hypothetical protein